MLAPVNWVWLKTLYASARNMICRRSLFKGKTLVSEGEFFMPHAHTFCVDPDTHLAYFPLQDIVGHPAPAHHGACAWQLVPDPRFCAVSNLRRLRRLSGSVQESSNERALLR